MATGLQGDIRGRPTGILTCLTQSANFCVSFTGTFVPTFPDDSVALGNHAANPGVGVGRVATTPGQLNGTGHHRPVTICNHALPFPDCLSANALATSAAVSPLP